MCFNDPRSTLARALDPDRASHVRQNKINKSDQRSEMILENKVSGRLNYQMHWWEIKLALAMASVTHPSYLSILGV